MSPWLRGGCFLCQIAGQLYLTNVVAGFSGIANFIIASRIMFPFWNKALSTIAALTLGRTRVSVSAVLLNLLFMQMEEPGGGFNSNQTSSNKSHAEFLR